MHITKTHVLYTKDEVNRYGALWERISQVNHYEDWQKSLARKLRLAKEDLLCAGADPISPEADAFAVEIKGKALELDDRLSELELIWFVFFVLHHNDRELSYDLSAPSD